MALKYTCDKTELKKKLHCRVRFKTAQVHDLNCCPPGVGPRTRSSREHWCRIKGPCVQPELVGSFSSVKSPLDQLD